MTLFQLIVPVPNHDVAKNLTGKDKDISVGEMIQVIQVIRLIQDNQVRLAHL